MEPFYTALHAASRGNHQLPFPTEYLEVSCLCGEYATGDRSSESREVSLTAPSQDTIGLLSLSVPRYSPVKIFMASIGKRYTASLPHGHRRHKTPATLPADNLTQQG
jgi:hypothetical protein